MTTDIRLADDERLELLLVGGSLERKNKSRQNRTTTKKLFGSPPKSFSAGADLIKVKEGDLD